MSYFSQVKKYSNWWFVVLIGGLLGLLFSWGDVAVQGYETSKVGWFLWWVRGLIGVSVWHVFKQGKMKYSIDRFVLYSLLLFIVVASVVSLLSPNVFHSLVGNIYRRDGLITLSHLIALAVTVGLFWQEKWRTGLSLSILISAGVTCLWELFNLHSFISVGAGNPSINAGLLVVAIPFGAYMVLKTKNVLWASLVVFLIAGIVEARAWGALLSLAGGALFFLLLLHSHRRWMLGLGVVISIIAMSLIGYYFYQHDFSTLSESSYYSESRLRIVTKLLIAVRNNPLGWGWSQVDRAFQSVDWPIPVNHDIYLDKAHSEWLEVAVTTGIMGLVAFLVFQVRIVYLAWSKRHRSSDKQWANTVLLTIVLYIFHSQTNIVSINEQVVFWIMVGLSARIDIPTRSSYAQNTVQK
jgi:O-antigen ligase